MVRLINLMKLNDIDIKSFSIIALSIQLGILSCYLSNLIGLRVPLLGQVLGFLYLLFIPGFTILRILKVHNLNNIENFIYAMGLSLAFIMFHGFILNTLYTYSDAKNSISSSSILISLNIIISILIILSYIIDKDFSYQDYFDFKKLPSPYFLFVSILPIMAVCGTFLANNFACTTLIYLLLFSLITIPLLATFKFINNDKYPFVLYSVSLSLLFHNSLVSTQLVQWGDVAFEYYYSSLVLDNGIWDPSINNNVNAMLSIVMLIPIFSLISDVNVIWVFKIFFPLIYAFLPLGIYRILQQQTSDTIAFLSSFLFSSFFVFFVTMLGMNRMQIAELFFICIILLIINKEIEPMQRSILLIIFSFSLVVSHYALSYIVMFLLITAWIISMLVVNRNIQKILRRENYFDNFSEHSIKLLSSKFILLFCIFLLAWYIHMSSSSSFIAIVNISDNIVNNIFADFLNPASSSGMSILLDSPDTWAGKGLKIVHQIMQIFIIVGFISYFLCYEAKRLRYDFILLSISSFALLTASIIIPHFTGIGAGRIYHISLIFLSYFGILGVKLFI